MIETALSAPDLRSEKLISDIYRFIWVGIPKSATRSILTLLHRDPPLDFGTRQVTDELQHFVNSNGQYRDYFKFTFVRNPWSRVVSTYFNKIRTEKEEVRRMFAGRYPGLHDDMSFEQFVTFLVEHPQGSDKHADRHWISQHLFLIDDRGDVLVDFIGKVENLANDFGQITNRLGLGTFELPVLNTRQGWNGNAESLSLSDPYEYRQYYTAKTREMIRQRYAVDIESFQYDF